MPRPKGLPKTGGRKKGVCNRINIEAKEAALAFLNSVGPAELKRIWQKAKAHDPNAALRVYYTALEFVAPKLQRREVTGADGKPQAVEVRHVTLSYPVPSALPPKEPSK